MTAEPIHPRDEDAAEYVLGTLGPTEREAFARDMAADIGLARAVRAWEGRLAPLASGLPEVAPSAALWDRIAAGIGGPARGEVVALAAFEALRRSRTRWRVLATGAGALAASLLAALLLPRFGPTPDRSALLAVVNRSGELPALIVRVDLTGGTVQVRSLAAERPSGRSLELWSILPGEAPRSLGLVAGDVTRLVIPAGARAPEGATIAVTLEPAGGAPGGVPTGPVVYSGKLVPETP